MNEVILTDTAQRQLMALEHDRSRKYIEKAVWYYGPRKNQVGVAAITPHP